MKVLVVVAIAFLGLLSVNAQPEGIDTFDIAAGSFCRNIEQLCESWAKAVVPKKDQLAVVYECQRDFGDSCFAYISPLLRCLRTITLGCKGAAAKPPTPGAKEEKKDEGVTVANFNWQESVNPGSPSIPFITNVVRDVHSKVTDKDLKACVKRAKANAKDGVTCLDRYLKAEDRRSAAFLDFLGL
eukprot:TRINITY_DN3584_c0_g1_i1.p1 TRINITY_DN3584_c0_g1~~TRINITY_DN3584_c0_g1_i1.p1  ORF type:complete len:185 (-),score=47.76 TRINITY_DN3584_c0_g1_i1:104-658(-)